MTDNHPEGRVAVLIPCFNEAPSIAKVVSDFKMALPGAAVYVYDNNSVDRSVVLARSAGAIVRSERQQGKGHVVRRMFSDIQADIYVLVDGDGTYDTDAAHAMIRLLCDEQLDMVVASRVHDDPHAYRAGHRLGNALLNRFVSRLFGKRFTDILSGYRVFSRRFVKSFPALSKGFETESELTIHALELCLPVAEVPTRYLPRPAGSSSKLSTYRDGFRILRLILSLYKHEKPLGFFGAIAIALQAIAVALSVPIIMEWLHTGLVPRFPTAILATGIVILSFLSLTAGLILETVTRGRQEMKRLTYLQMSHPARPGI